jgi:hypothetical protein
MPPRSWILTGNSGTQQSENFVGTTDNQPLAIRTNGIEAMRITAGLSGQTTEEGGGDVGVGTAQPKAKLHVASAGGRDHPQIQLTQTKPMDAARLRFFTLGAETNGRQTQFWDISASGSMNFFSQRGGHVMTLVGAFDDQTRSYKPRVGVGTQEPTSALDVRGTATVEVLQVTGGADVAERFPVDAEAPAEPGSVMVIDENKPAHLRPCDRAYDRQVAGIVSGAGASDAGVRLKHESNAAEGAYVALSGCALCLADATTHSIRPGDLLTTSDNFGHAMRVIDPNAARGAIVGKALSALTDRTGLVLVLVSLL